MADLDTEALMASLKDRRDDIDSLVVCLGAIRVAEKRAQYLRGSGPLNAARFVRDAIAGDLRLAGVHLSEPLFIDLAEVLARHLDRQAEQMRAELRARMAALGIEGGAA